ncbi:hypothetical protein CR513_07282, partial [Mucuna pruriens]
MEARGETMPCFCFVESRYGDNTKHHLLTSHRLPKQWRLWEKVTYASYMLNHDEGTTLSSTY